MFPVILVQAAITLLAALLCGGCGQTAPVGTATGPAGQTPAEPAQPADFTPVDTTPAQHIEPALVGDASPEEPPAPTPSFRPPDERPRHDVDAAAAHGIRLYESRRLKLYTDIKPEEATSLPPLLDALFDEWEEYFGPLPPARDGSEFQLTGYLMRDQRPFREAGLLPENLPVFAHGKHDRQQFWMNDQDHPYYRRHLLLHEATHCYMQMMGGTTVDVPVWYLEGMAELFATHTLDEDGTPHFRVVPDAPENFVGYGRIEMIDQDVREGRELSLSQLTAMSTREFQQLRSAYAWSWVTCLLADQNLNYRDAFRELARRYPEEGFANVRTEVFDPLAADFTVEWMLLTRALDYGHDIELAAIDFDAGQPIDTAEHASVSTSVEARSGWQSSGVAVSPGTTYQITATGQVTLANNPKPWISEPNGVTIRYAHGQRIGQLQGIVIGEVTGDSPSQRYVSDIFPIGTGTTFNPEAAGTLYFRVNDFGSELSDNSGAYEVTIDAEAR